ncbi:serine hydrolase, partial [Mesorhizobium sp. M2E.F.Ca.ET.154.01.1.1]|uniref:serine hydrolase n=3 Tax=Mesorhizobium TaxID=68287 RepID=UPI0010931F22
NTVNFSQAFWDDLFSAIADGNNAAAGRCIQRLGFGYITTAASEANFFDADTNLGMWLCGDFGLGYPPQRISCSNDGPTAQGATAYQMAKLFTLLLDAQLVDPASDAAMLNLLQQAVVRLHLFLNRDTTVQYVTTHSKIGLGPVNAGFAVASEALIIQENTTQRQFVVVFQNQPFATDPSVFPVARVVDATIASYLFP